MTHHDVTLHHAQLLLTREATLAADYARRGGTAAWVSVVRRFTPWSLNPPR